MPSPEFIREGKVFPFPYSVYQQLITEEMSFDPGQENQAYSYSYATRIVLTGRANRQTWAIRPPEGNCYHLEGIRVYYPLGVQNAVELTTEIIQAQRGRVNVQAPTPIPLLTTPADARPKHHMVRVNVTIGYNSDLVITLQGNDGTDPSYVDMLTEGLMIPTQNVEV